MTVVWRAFPRYKWVRKQRATTDARGCDRDSVSVRRDEMKENVIGCKRGFWPDKCLALCYVWPHFYPMWENVPKSPEYFKVPGHWRYLWENNWANIRQLLIHIPSLCPGIYSFLNWVIKVPICGSNKTRNSSPSLMNWGEGFFAAPTPGGVPVIMTVPAGRVVPWERKAMSWGTVKIMSLRGSQ